MPFRLSLATIAVTGLGLALAVAGFAPASAGPITVTRFDDPEPDGCSPTDCSLREATVLANHAPGRDSIILAAGTYELTRSGSYQDWPEDASLLSDLDIAGDAALVGAGRGVTIITAGNAGERGIDILAGVDAEISHLSIDDIDITWPGPGCGAGIRNLGTLRLSHVSVTGNFKRGEGGGICNYGGTLSIADSIISGNCACFTGYGSGIYNSGPLTIERVVISGNRTDFGSGGGIAGGGHIVIRDSVVTGNETTTPAGTQQGGGLYVGGVVELTNVTISGNRTDEPDPGYEDVDTRGGGASLSGDVTLTNVTITGNETSATAGGLYYSGSGTLTLVNTIIAGNTGGDCEGPITSGGHNIDGDASCGLGAAGDMMGVDPLLGPLANNGGPTETHALLEGSPAIDAGDAAACPAGDQRGYPRPTGAGCDIGAFEAGAAPPSPTASPPPTPTAAPVVRGDADCDDDVDSVDALAALRVAALLPPYPNCLLAANVDCSLAIDSVDALFILRFVAALPVNLPPGCPPIGPP